MHLEKEVEIYIPRKPEICYCLYRNTFGSLHGQFLGTRHKTQEVFSLAVKIQGSFKEYSRLVKCLKILL